MRYADLDPASASPDTPRNRDGAPAAIPGVGAAPRIELSAKEAREYSFSRAALAAATERTGRKVAGLAVDISQELERAGVGRPHGGILVPLEIEVRALHDTFTVTKGAELAFTEPRSIIAELGAQLRVAGLGAKVLSGLIGDLRFPRATGAITASWVSESPTGDVAASAMTFDNVALLPHPISCTTSFSRKLLAQAAEQVAADRIIRTGSLRALARELDRAAIAGSGVSNEPRGILNTAGIGSVTLGANGGTPTADTLIDLEFEVAVDGADDLGALGVLTTPAVRKRLRKSAWVSASSGVPVWSGDTVLGGTPGRVSTNVPSTGTKGTSTTICHSIILGAWADLVIAAWSALEVVVDPFAAKRKADIELTVYGMFDCAPQHPQAFAAVVDALA